MSVPANEPRQHLSTLTNGWRFTLPTPIRKSRGWDAGISLTGRLRGTSLVFTADATLPPEGEANAHAHAETGRAGGGMRESVEMGDTLRPSAAGHQMPMPTRGNLAGELGDGEIPPVECYLGSGGKIVLPVSIRKHLGWVIGKRLVIIDEGDAVSVTSCCDAKRCESCGSISGVRQIIQNIYLCSQCWDKYLRAMNNKLKWGRAKA